jgi:PAT family beta-lactamase induction signal transducer AmpG
MWQAVMIACAGSMGLLAVYHLFFLPKGSTTERPHSAKQVVQEFVGTAESFFHKRMFWGMIAFVFLYRLGEGLITMEGQLFLQSSVEKGGLGLSVDQVSNIDAVYGTIANLAGGLLGGLFVSRLGLSRSLWILGLCLNIPHITFVVLSHLAAAGHGLPYSTIVTLVSIEKFGYGFGFVGNMIYMMQQLAPGRSTMTHYAYATALMNLMLVPTNMISGPLAEMLGYSTYFIVMMAASIPSAWAAFKAPFPHKHDDHGAESGITADDPTRLSPAEREAQRLAGRASMFAMLNILTLLVADSWILGTLQGMAQGQGMFQFTLLVGTTILKGLFTYKTFEIAARATADAREIGRTVYLGNARGAKIATIVCGLVTIAVLAFGARMAF